MYDYSKPRMNNTVWVILTALVSAVGVYGFYGVFILTVMCVISGWIALWSFLLSILERKAPKVAFNDLFNIVEFAILALGIADIITAAIKFSH
jgi:hypothetical protein